MRLLLASLILGGCASLPTAPVNLVDQPARAVIRYQCGDELLSAQGTVACEQKGSSPSRVFVKVPPLEGRVVYSTGELKKTGDFNWHPEEGFLLWKERPLKDTWVPLELGQVFGNWPVAIDVLALNGSEGVVTTRGLVYHRVCNDLDTPCSKLVTRFYCAGEERETGLGKIGACDRMAGPTQTIEVLLKAGHYSARSGGKIYLSAPKLGLKQSYTLKESDIARGSFKVDLPEVKPGATLVLLAMDWLEGGKLAQTETRILFNGYSPDWAGLDKPHPADRGTSLDWVKPFMADILEVDLYRGQTLVKKAYSRGKISGFPKPALGEVACGFAWQRAASDLSYVCLNHLGQEVGVP